MNSARGANQEMRDAMRKGASFVDWLSKRLKPPKSARASEPGRRGSHVAEAEEHERSERAAEQRAETLEPIIEPARISLVYESRDGRLCLFEDGDGHLTAVRAENLA